MVHGFGSNAAPFVFRAVTIAEVDDYLKNSSFFGSSESRAKIKYIREYPGVSGSFPCLFSFEEPEGRIISACWAIPDQLHCFGKLYPWAWGGEMVTIPRYQGKGLATQLLREEIRVFLSLGYGWGGVFATPASFHIVGKLGTVTTGYASRLLLSTSLGPFVQAHIGNFGILASVLSRFLRVFSKGWILLARTKANSPRHKGVSKEIPWTDLAAVDSAMVGVQTEAPYRFYSSGTIARLKAIAGMEVGAGQSTFYSLSTQEGQRIGSYILRRNWQKRPLAGRYKDFWRITFMDYGFTSLHPDRYSLLAKEVVLKFLASGADWLEVITSDESLIDAFRKALLVRVTKGMSFQFKCPDNWNLAESCMQVKNWHLSHFSGDGFFF